MKIGHFFQVVSAACHDGTDLERMKEIMGMEIYIKVNTTMDIPTGHTIVLQPGTITFNLGQLILEGTTK